MPSRPSSVGEDVPRPIPRAVVDDDEFFFDVGEIDREDARDDLADGGPLVVAGHHDGQFHGRFYRTRQATAESATDIPAGIVAGIVAGSVGRLGRVAIRTWHRERAPSQSKGPTPRGHATPGLQNDVRLHRSELEESVNALTGHASDLSANLAAGVHRAVDVQVRLAADQRLEEVFPRPDALIGGEPAGWLRWPSQTG